MSVGQVISLLADEVARPFGIAVAEAGPEEARLRAVLFAIRMPRVLASVLIGACLAVSGAALQGLFRNPLAGPALVGVSSGAALAAAAVIVIGPAAGGIWTRPLAAFAGSIASTVLVYALATRDGKTDVATMLLAGVAVNSIAGAGNGLFTFIADDAELRDITFWTLGSLGGITWRSLSVTAPVMLASMLALPRLSRQLNTLLLGERQAVYTGTNVQLVKGVSIAAVAAGVGAAVSIAGIIGFVGLVAPHLVRLAIGPDYRTLIPGSAVLGAILLLLADLLARTVVAPAELPIGIVTALVGGPFFVWLLMRHRARRRGYA
jgi:iron complex transport system permease protein